MTIIMVWCYFSFFAMIVHQNWLIMAHGTIKRTHVIVNRLGSKILQVSEKNVFITRFVNFEAPTSKAHETATG